MMRLSKHMGTQLVNGFEAALILTILTISKFEISE
jgi:hypothetical protein